VTWGLRVFWIHLAVIVLLVAVRYLRGGVGYIAGSAASIQHAIDFMVAQPLEANYQRLPAWFFALLGHQPISLYFADVVLYGLAGGLAYFLIGFAVALAIGRRRGNAPPEAAPIRS
jgi:hypothetical protein